jgi:hypothetical protein
VTANASANGASTAPAARAGSVSGTEAHTPTRLTTASGAAHSSSGCGRVGSSDQAYQRSGHQPASVVQAPDGSVSQRRGDVDGGANRVVASNSPARPCQRW